MENIFETNKQINAKIGAETEGATTFELVKAQVAKLGGDTSKVVDIRTGEQQVLEHIKPAGPDVVIQTSKDVSISANGTTVVSPDAGYDAIKDVVVDVNVPDPELEELSVTANGTYTPTKYGYSKVDVAVPSKPEQTKSVTINQNGTTSVLPDEGSVLSKVDVTVNVAGGGGGDLFGFDAIGYNGTEQNLKDDVAYSKQIYDNWDPSTTSMYKKFENDTKLVYMPKVDTSNVTNMQGTFNNCTSLTTLPMLDTSNVTDMSYVSGRYPSYFLYNTKVTKLPAWDLRKVYSIQSAFYFSKLQSFDFDMPALRYADFAFKYCSDLKTVNITNAAPETLNDMFAGCRSLIKAPMLDTSKVTDMGVYNSNYQGVFSGCSSLVEAPNWNTSNVTTMESMFDGCRSLTTVPQYDTSKVTNMMNMFYGCTSLVEATNLNTSNVTNMINMFFGCTSLVTLPQYDTSKATNIETMFYNCSKLTNFGGLLNIGQAFTSTFTYDLSATSLLTDESIHNVINCLYDMTAKGFSPTLKFHSDVYAKLTDAQKAQITAKNWTVTA